MKLGPPFVRDSLEKFDEGKAGENCNAMAVQFLVWFRALGPT